MNYYIFKINSLNLVYIWFLRLLNIKVIYHRCDLRRKNIIPKNCRQVDYYRDTDHWLECLDECYQEVRLFFEKNKIDTEILPRSMAEMIAKTYQDLKCFKSLCFSDQNYTKGTSIICMPFYSESKLFDSLGFKTNFFTFLDFINEFRANFIVHLTHTYIILASIKNKKFNFEVNNIITGVAPPSSSSISPTSLNVFWLTDEGIIPPKGTIYYFPFLSRVKNIPTNIITVNHISVCSQIGMIDRFGILISKFGCILQSFYCLSIEKSFVLKNIFMKQTWTEFHQATGFKNFITNISDLWPSLRSVEILNDLGVNTILWSYSYYGVRASKKNNYKGKILNLSFTSFSHIFVWDQKLIDLYKSCEINPTNKIFKKEYYISGPLIPGSIKHINFSQQEALTAINLLSFKDKIIVSVFDLPVINSEFRRNRGLGPVTSSAIQERFYQGIFELIHSNNELVVLIKSKRKSPDSETGLWLEKISTLQNSHQVFIIEESTSPILLIKASDFVITSPFTSTSKIAELCGVKNCYYDPSETFNFITVLEDKILNKIPDSFFRKSEDRERGAECQLNPFVEKMKQILNS